MQYFGFKFREIFLHIVDLVNCNALFEDFLFELLHGSEHLSESRAVNLHVPKVHIVSLLKGVDAPSLHFYLLPEIVYLVSYGLQLNTVSVLLLEQLRLLKGLDLDVGKDLVVIRAHSELTSGHDKLRFNLVKPDQVRAN